MKSPLLGAQDTVSKGLSSTPYNFLAFCERQERATITTREGGVLSIVLVV